MRVHFGSGEVTAQSAPVFALGSPGLALGHCGQPFFDEPKDTVWTAAAGQQAANHVGPAIIGCVRISACPHFAHNRVAVTDKYSDAL